MRLTPAQKHFLWTLREEPDVWAQCASAEWRTAKALERHGLVELPPDVSAWPKGVNLFEARIAQKGMAKAHVAALMSRYRPSPPEQGREE